MACELYLDQVVVTFLTRSKLYKGLYQNMNIVNFRLRTGSLHPIFFANMHEEHDSLGTLLNVT